MIKSYYKIPDGHKAILDKRLNDHKVNPNNGRSWQKIKLDIKSKYSL